MVNPFHLLNSVDQLAAWLLDELTGGDALDAFLLAAGMNQITEDWLHRAVPLLGFAAARLVYLQGSKSGRLTAALGQHAHALAAQARSRTAAERRVMEWQSELADLVHDLADLVAASSVSTPGSMRAGRVEPARAEKLLDRLAGLPIDLRGSLLRLPTCFRSLDQHPLDCAALVDAFGARNPDRRRPVLVVGVRTSGSYLAPLHAAFLRRAGFEQVSAISIRPRGFRFGPATRALRAAACTDARVLIADDPPSSGVALTSVAAEMERIGIPRRNITLLITLLGPAESLPAALQDFASVLLPAEGWHIQRRLQPERVRLDFERLIRGKCLEAPGGSVQVSRVAAVERLPLEPVADLLSGSPVRRHVRARFRVTLVDDVQHRQVEHEIYVKGVGLGYFGRHAQAVGDALARFIPQHYGVVDGLLYRDWLSEDRRLRIEGGAREPAAAHHIADYVSQRRRALALADDPSRRLAGQQPAWERVLSLFRAAFRQVKPTLIETLITRAATRLLSVRAPSVVDGSMSPRHWLTYGETPGALLKVDYDERAYSNQDTVTDQLYCFDAGFDIAALSAALELEQTDAARGFARQVRASYESRSGEQIDPERFFLYAWLYLESYIQFLNEELFPGVFSRRRSQLPACGGPGRADLALELERARRAQASFSQSYFRERVFHDVAPADDGPLCAIDLDGVLETLWLGFLAITPAGARAIRALTCHGYRPVLVTGRSLRDVQDRCDAYQLAGGVAEYGAAVYVQQTREVRNLLSPAQRQDLERLRSEAESTPGLYVDPTYQYAVRVYHLVPPAKRRGLSEAMVAQLLERAGVVGRVTSIPGVRQTDFMVPDVDKATGVRVLRQALQAGASEGDEIALAVGDTLTDLPMLELADRAFAPANADATLIQHGVELLPGAYQAGLEQAIGRLIGHRPGACRTCAPGAAPSGAKLMLTILGAQDRGRWGSLVQAGRLLQAFRQP